MDMTHRPTDFENLVNSACFEDFTQVMIKLTGLAIALNSPEGVSCNKFHGGNRNNKICVMIRNSKQGLPLCEECDRRHFRLAAQTGKPQFYTCHAGFWDIAVPILVQERHIATISSGQVLPDPVSEEGFRTLRQRLAWLKVSDQTLRKGYESAPYMPKTQLRYVMSLLEMFARQLCESLNQIRELEEKLEKEEIRKAKEFISTHYGDSLLSLTEVASHVGFSKAHFSHIFKSMTGMAFTSFVQNCRIAAAKQRLAGTDQSITDICFDCGFNSMTHFNRVFRALEKMSPRDYRRTTNPPQKNNQTDQIERNVKKIKT